MNKVFINGLKENPLIFTDIGAAGGISKRWDDLKESIITILFEPNKESFNDLKLNNDKKSIILNKALFSEKKIININICRKPEVSSIYKPSIEFISNFYDSKRFDIIDIIELEADTLSNQLNISNIKNLDFIKIDTQGSELDILKGCNDFFSDIIGLEIEAEFEEVYLNQPLFHDVYKYIIDRGFMLYDIKRYYWKRLSDQKFIMNKGQLIFGDLLFIKSPESIMTHIINKKSDDQYHYIMKAIFIYISYKIYDAAYQLIFKSNEIIKNDRAEIMNYISYKIKSDKYSFYKRKIKNFINLSKYQKSNFKSDRSLSI